MPHNPFQHVRPGEPFRLVASTYNLLLDTALAGHFRRVPLEMPGHGLESLHVHVENRTGQALPKFSVVALDGPAIEPDEEYEDEFCSRIILRGVVPGTKDAGKFAITQQDAEPDQIVRACLIGVTIARIRTDKEKVESCDCRSGDTESLAATGSAQVLWIADVPEENEDEEEATPDKEEEKTEPLRWAIIRIGTGGSSNMIYSGIYRGAWNGGGYSVEPSDKSLLAKDAETIHVKLPPLYCAPQRSDGDPCRFYRNADNEWEFLDFDCVYEIETEDA